MYNNEERSQMIITYTRKGSYSERKNMGRPKECKFRHENGNCLKFGGFCTSVPDKYCDMAIKLKETECFQNFKKKNM